MTLTIEKAHELLEEARKMNPGEWIDHCINSGKVAGAIAAECDHLDEEKAQAYAMIHDIGRRYGRSGMRHTIDGYRFMKEIGYEDAARICLTHSHPTLNMFDGCGQWDCSDEDKKFVQDFLDNHQLDDYDRICQLGDALGGVNGIVMLETRLIGVHLRHGFNDYTQEKWGGFIKTKKYFEDKIGRSLYELFPEAYKNCI